MTERLYFEEPYRTRFGAKVAERMLWNDQPAVVLDRTAFYPTGGGQPHDTGALNGIPVIRVEERGTDGAVMHILGADLQAEPGDEVEGELNWERRFDLMQQHTGQHILSAAFLEVLGAQTVGFHLSDTYATIDLDRAPLSAADLDRVEDLTNSVVFEDRDASARFVPDEDLAGLRLRKPLSHEGPVRIVEIPGLDCSACGGTHVRTTGEVGLVKIARSERRGAETRIEFLCGRRALVDYRVKNALVLDLAQEFTVGFNDLADTVHRLAEDLKETRRELRRSRDALLDAEATALWHEAEVIGDRRVVVARFAERGPDDLRHLAQRLASRPRSVVLLGAGQQRENKGHFVFARSGELDLHMGRLMQLACEVAGGRGGGRPEFAQGGSPQGDGVGRGLDAAYQHLAASTA